MLVARNEAAKAAGLPEDLAIEVFGLIHKYSVLEQDKLK